MSRKAERDKEGRAASSRLDKLLSQEGLGTRSEIGKAIRKGMASVNGVIVKDPGLRVSEEDQILFDRKPVFQKSHVYYMLNKPAGVISATEDGREQTVLDLLRDPACPVTAAPDSVGGISVACLPEPVLRKGLFPVGRLDKDTEGLLLITDDGQLAHRLLAPGKHVDKTYYALVSGRVTEEDIRAFGEGLDVDGEFAAMPAQLRTDPEADSACAPLIPTDIRGFIPEKITQYSQTLVTIREGKYHQIKRMFASRGKEVLYLKRLSMGPLYLDASLAPGKYRPLTQAEIDQLLDFHS
jgi:16S rRNA pseudouridine516 synthase